MSKKFKDWVSYPLWLWVFQTVKSLKREVSIMSVEVDRLNASLSAVEDRVAVLEAKPVPEPSVATAAEVNAASDRVDAVAVRLDAVIAK